MSEQKQQRAPSIEDATNPVAPDDYDPDSLDCFGGAQRAADLARVPAVLALAATLHFDAGLRAEVAVSAAEQQLGIGYCGDAVQRRLFELGLHQFRDDQENS